MRAHVLQRDIDVGPCALPCQQAVEMAKGADAPAARRDLQQAEPAHTRALAVPDGGDLRGNTCRGGLRLDDVVRARPRSGRRPGQIAIAVIAARTTVSLRPVGRRLSMVEVLCVPGFRTANVQTGTPVGDGNRVANRRYDRNPG